MAWDVATEFDSADLASIQGMRELREYVERLPDDYKAIRELVFEGSTDQLAELLRDLQLARKQFQPHADVAATIDGLIGFIMDQSEAKIIYVSDGLTDEDVEENWVISGEE